MNTNLAEIRNPKSEIRSPKRNHTADLHSEFGFRPYFGFRISDFGFGTAVCLFGAALLLTGCGKKHEPASGESSPLPAATVRVQKIETVKQPAIEDVVGTVQPKLQAVIEARVSGRVTQLPVTLGQAVKEGDLLVEISAQETQAKLEQASAVLHQAELEFNRISKLRQAGAATQSELDAVQSRFQGAQAAVAEAQAMVGYAKIVAPFDAVVARKLADVGDLAMPGKPLLELEGKSGLQLIADVPTALAGRVKPGDKLAIRVDTLPDAITGTVAEIAPAADPASRTVRAKVDFPGTEKLRGGQFGRLGVPVSDASFLFVPTAALVQRGQLEIVFVAVDGKAQMRLVRSGKQTAEGVEILSGLNPGETVVVEGAALLRDGQPLK